METEEYKKTPMGGAQDNLETISGIGSISADALYRIGIRCFADLAQHTPEGLAKTLREQLGVKISPKRIAAENWIGQAKIKTLMSAEQIPSMEEGAMEKETGAVSSAPLWQQHAGFSIFFDTVTVNEDTPIWQTRLYHEETGNEALLPEIDTTAWVQWILERAELPITVGASATTTEVPPPPSTEPPPAEPASAALSTLTTPYDAQVEILDVQVFEALATPPGEEKKQLVVETCFQITGVKAEEMTNDRIPFRIETHAINLTSGESSLLASQPSQLQPQVYEYTLQLDFPVPDFGRYTIYTLVLLLPPCAMMTYYQGPNLHVVLPE